MTLAGTYTYEGETDEVTTTVVTSADPLGRVVVEREVTTVGDGVVMVRNVVGVGDGDGGGGVVVGAAAAVEVVWATSLVQEPYKV